MTVNEIEVTVLDGDHFEVIVAPDGYELHIIEGDPIEVSVLAEGLQGPQGIPGDPGPPSDAFEYVHIQDVAAEEWVVPHNLNGYPNVTTVDTLNREFLAEIRYDSINQLTVILAIAGTGKAFCS